MLLLIVNVNECVKEVAMLETAPDKGGVCFLRRDTGCLTHIMYEGDGTVSRHILAAQQGCRERSAVFVF